MAPTHDRDAFGEDYFARTYGGGPGSYAARATSNKWRSMCRFIADRAQPSAALDIGCAEGAFLRYATRWFPNARWSGVDVSAYALARARSVAPNAELREGTVTALPFQDGAFDLVTAFDILEHVPDLPAAARELARVVRPGGELVVVVPVYDGPLGWLVRRLDRDPTHLHIVGRRFWLDGVLHEHFDLDGWQGTWRYYLLRYWHVRATLGRQISPAIVTSWRRRR
ncbi:class I SAM-dependent methyltransferase [Pendulispora brunnea]|uniref:Class I SAM-dependent methyltransferase n=1 Tax=Pendulispora brunnea TaxID=2905690 RepID=A0ABZ2K2L6_9BACT